MYAKVYVASVFAITGLPSAIAAECRIEASASTNSAGFGLGGTTHTNGNDIILYKDGDEIWKAGDGDASACRIGGAGIDHGDDDLSDLKFIGTCGPTLKKCKIEYNDEEVEGEVDSDTNFYGLGASASSTCLVEWDC